MNARRFVGQGDSSEKDKGMDREAQQAVLREFKQGAFNVLVATKAAEEGLDVADCDLVVFYEATACVIQFVQRQGRAGRRRDGTVAILLANSTADAVHAAVLDAKLARLPGIYYNVRRLKLEVVKQDAGPAIRVRPGALFHKELVRELAVRGFDAVLDRSIAGDVALPGGIGARIITR
nr:helicase-related protein [Candidatus Sigynarchaeum springense]